MALNLPIEADANELVQRSPLALLVAMVLDQQITFEKAFSSPYVLQQRLGRPLDAADLAGQDPVALAAIFSQPPALHRFPKAMAGRVQEVCQVLVDQYDGDASQLWSGAQTGGELLNRITALPGFGRQKSQIFLALLGKQFDVQPEGWREAAGSYGEEGSFHSIADIVDAESLAKVREYKRQTKAAARTVLQ